MHGRTDKDSRWRALCGMCVWGEDRHQLVFCTLSCLHTHACNEPVHQNKISQTYMDFLEITVNHHKHLWIKDVDQYILRVKSMLSSPTVWVGEEVKGSGFECGRETDRQQAWIILIAPWRMKWTFECMKKVQRIERVCRTEGAHRGEEYSL